MRLVTTWSHECLSQQNDTHLTSNPSHPRALEHRSPFQTTRLLPGQQLGFHQGSVMVPNATRMALWFIQHFLNPKDVSQCLHLKHYKRMVLMMSFQLCNSLAHFWNAVDTLGESLEISWSTTGCSKMWRNLETLSKTAVSYCNLRSAIPFSPKELFFTSATLLEVNFTT